jgi:sugar phosphate isomerase/epimerase
MKREYSLAYLSACHSTVNEALQIAAQAGYSGIGIRLLPNSLGAPCQKMLGEPALLRQARAIQADTGVKVFDLEIIRIGEAFEIERYTAFLEAGAALGARAVLVAGDDNNLARLSEHYGRLCERLKQYQLSADLEFMPWTGVPDAMSALQVVQMANFPANAGILVDALHVDRSGTTPAQIASLPRHLLHYAQICDASDALALGRALSTQEMIHTARCERLQPGEGAIALAPLFAALPSDLPISVEVVHLERMRQLSALEWAKQCLAASRLVLNEKALRK